MSDSLFCVVTHSLHEGWVADNLADIFVDKGVSGRIVVSGKKERKESANLGM